MCQAAEAEAERQKLEEQERQAELIRQERQRLLREAAYLKDYLPKGVLQDLEDLRIINDAAAGQSGSRQPAGLCAAAAEDCGASTRGAGHRA